MKVLAVEPLKAPYVKEIGEGLEALQKAVGGYIEVVYPWKDEVAVICNDEGKINGLPLNRGIKDDEGTLIDIIAGDFIIIGLGEKNFIGLSDEYIEKYSKLFANGEVFVNIGGKIEAISAAI